MNTYEARHEYWTGGECEIKVVTIQADTMSVNEDGVLFFVGEELVGIVRHFISVKKVIGA